MPQRVSPVAGLFNCKTMLADKFKELSIEEAQTLCLARNIPFFSYRLPGGKGCHFAAQTSEEIARFDGFVHKPDQNGFILVPFDTESKLPSLFIREDLSFTDRTDNPELIRKLRTTCYPAKPVDRENTDSDREEYFREISVFLSALKQEKLKKAILSRSITHTGETLQKAPELFTRMVKHYPGAFVFLVSAPGITTWMGATPEIFLRQDSSAITTMALAGTQAAQNTPRDTVWDYKDCEEQQIVSNYIYDILEKACGKDTIHMNDPYTRQAGNVCHLCTDFRCAIPPDSARTDLLCGLLHPTPAVGGFPKATALELIRETEKHDRRYYAGYLGTVHSDGTFDLFVNLRSMEIFPDACRLYAGGGITALSNPEKEWKETEIKLHTLLNLLTNPSDAPDH